MTKEEALAAIKALRDKINDVQDPTEGGWVNPVLHHLDQASDAIEFPKRWESSSG